MSIDFGLTPEEITKRLVDQTLGVLEGQGTPIDGARGKAILTDFNADVRKAVHRVTLRLEAAAKACEAVDGRRGRLTWCEQAGMSIRDGHRVCLRHAQARDVRWS